MVPKYDFQGFRMFHCGAKFLFLVFLNLCSIIAFNFNGHLFPFHTNSCAGYLLPNKLLSSNQQYNKLRSHEKRTPRYSHEHNQEIEQLLKCYAHWRKRGFSGYKLDKIMEVMERVHPDFQTEDAMENWETEMMEVLDCKGLAELQQVVWKEPELVAFDPQTDIVPAVQQLQSIFGKDGCLIAKGAPSILLEDIETKIPKKIRTLGMVLPQSLDVCECIAKCPTLLLIHEDDLAGRVCAVQEILPLPPSSAPTYVTCWHLLLPKLVRRRHYDAELAERMAVLQDIFQGVPLEAMVKTVPHILIWDLSKITEKIEMLKNLLPTANILKIIKTNPKVLYYSIPNTVAKKIQFLSQNFPTRSADQLLEKNPGLLSLNIQQSLPQKISALESILPGIDAFYLVAKEPSLLNYKIDSTTIDRIEQIQDILDWQSNKDESNLVDVLMKYPNLLIYSKDTISQKVSILQNFLSNETIACIVAKAPKVLQMSPDPNIKNKVTKLRQLFPSIDIDTFISKAPTLLLQNVSPGLERKLERLQVVFPEHDPKEIAQREPSILCRNIDHLPAKISFLNGLNEKFAAEDYFWAEYPQVLTVNFSTLARLHYVSQRSDINIDIETIVSVCDKNIHEFIIDYPGYIDFLQSHFDQNEQCVQSSSSDRNKRKALYLIQKASSQGENSSNEVEQLEFNFSIYIQQAIFSKNTKQAFTRQKEYC